MLSKDSGNHFNEPQASSLPDPKAGEVLDPRSPIEVASTGNGTINDPAGKDKPPGA